MNKITCPLCNHTFDLKDHDEILKHMSMDARHRKHLQNAEIATQSNNHNPLKKMPN